jgi:3-oxoacyl-[acyl-carrier-protein] synthase-3
MSAAPYARLIGTGSALPARRVTNADLVAELAAKGIESSDSWITERTGIAARHFADANTHASTLAVQAARAALQSAGVAAADVDLIVVATSTPDMVFPSTACIVQHALGANGGAAFDVQAVCSGFVYAVSIAQAMLCAGSARRALVIGAEVFSRIFFARPAPYRAGRCWAARCCAWTGKLSSNSPWGCSSNRRARCCKRPA